MPLLAALENAPVIAAVKNIQAAQAAVTAPVGVVFILGGDIITVPPMVQMLHDAGKMVFVHLDLVNGLAGDQYAVRYVAHNWKLQGIISTHIPVIRAASEEGLMSVLRVFLLDSASLERGAESLRRSGADAIELIPGVIPKAIRRIHSTSPVHIIAGGMITERAEIYSALAAGALGVSTSQQDLWDM